MDLCYDAHGTSRTGAWLDLATTSEYCNDETFSARRSGKNIVLDFRSEDES